VGYIRKRKNKENVTVYYAEVRLTGYPYQTQSFTSREEAKQWIQVTESELRKGRNVIAGESRRHTFNDVVSRYLNVYLKQYPHRLSKQRQLLQWWNSKIGDLQLHQITPAVISELRDKLCMETTYRGKERSGATVNRYLAALSKVLTLCVREWCILEISPMPKVGKLKESSGKIRFLQDDELRRLFKACKESKNTLLYLAVVLAVTTGMRRNEIMTLTWSQVDLSNRFIHLQRTKNGSDRIIPLPVEVISLLSKLKADSTEEQVFPPIRKIGNRSGKLSLRSSFSEALKKAQISDASFHTLRHTAASHMAMQGANSSALQALLGHRTPSMSKRYTHFSDTYLRKVVQDSAEGIFNE
jgi:integrase